MTEIRTPRLTISPMAEAELEALIRQYESCAPALSLAYREMLDNCRKYPGQYIWYAPWKICLHDGDTALGSAGFKGFNGGRPEIGYGINDEYTGCGYAAEAVGGLCGWALGMPGVTAVEAEAEADNAGSRAVLFKNGFTETGEIGEEGPRFLLRRGV